MKYCNIIIALILLITCNSAHAQWQEVYDSGSSGITLYRDLDNIFNVNEYGTFITKNQGNSWEQVGQSLFTTCGWITRQDSLLLLTSKSGIYKSGDSGMTWKFQSIWKNGKGYGYWKISGKNLVGISLTERVGVSTDYGITWDSANLGLPQLKRSSDPKSSLRIFSGFLKSGDNLVLFADSEEYISNDHGLSWKWNTHCPFVGPTNMVNLNRNLFVSSKHIFSSTDSGTNWSSIFSPKSSYASVGGFSSNDKIIIACVQDEGVIISRDSGQNWYYINKGLSDLSQYSTAITSKYIFCTSEDKVFRRPLSEVTENFESNRQKELVSLKVYPNPLSNSTTFEFGRPLNKGTVTIYNMAGQEIEKIGKICVDKVTFIRNELPRGMYFYIVTENNQKLAIGKIELL